MSADAQSSQSYVEWNVDFSLFSGVDGNADGFQSTPMKDVKRMMFERRGGEVVKRATSCVQYAPNSHFSEHSHPGGEEYLVLTGTFSDHTGNYTKGWYIRNPVGSRHRPFSEEGCEIFVKLAQLPVEEQDYLQLNTEQADWTVLSDTEQALSLWQSQYETTTLHHLVAGHRDNALEFEDNVEFFVVSGSLTVNGETHSDHTWLRFPSHHPITLSTQESTTLYRKIGKGYVRT